MKRSRMPLPQLLLATVLALAPALQRRDLQYCQETFAFPIQISEKRCALNYEIS